MDFKRVLLPLVSALIVSISSGCASSLKATDKAQGQAVAQPRTAPTSADLEKVSWLASIRDASPESAHPMLGIGFMGEIEERLNAWQPGDSMQALFGHKWGYAIRLMRHGRLPESIEQFEDALNLIDANPDQFNTEELVESLYALALTYFRLAERSNCIAHHSTESCIFPLRGSGTHTDEEGARKAQATLERLIAIEGNHRMLEGRWLYNITHMALSTWPHMVESQHRLEEARFASSAPAGRMVDIGGDIGIGRFTRAGGAILDDFDGDGFQDVMTSSFDPAVPIKLCRNTGQAKVTDVSLECGLEGQLGGLNLVQADVNNDGRLDVLVLRGGHLSNFGEFPDSLLIQNEAGVFEDRTQWAGLDYLGPSYAACFGDIDNDGDLDLFVAYEAITGGQRELSYTSHLYTNDGQGRFEDVTATAGITTPFNCLGASFGDVDGDGLLDLFISSQESPNRLYRNLGQGRFDDVAAERGISEPTDSYASSFFDYDNDGDLDLLVNFYQFYLAEHWVAAWYWDEIVEGRHVHLFENDGRGFFRNVSAEAGLQFVCYPMGLGVGDVDHDGYQDIYLATGAYDMSSLWPNYLLRNRAGKSFEDITEAAGVGHLQKGQAVAFGDFENDGDQDILLQVGGFYPDDGFGDVLFSNPGNENHWLYVNLEGVRSNRFGVGASIRVRIAQPDGSERDIYSHGEISSFGGGSLRREIGLGDAERILEVEVHWPTSQTRQRLVGVSLDTIIEIREEIDAQN